MSSVSRSLVTFVSLFFLGNATQAKLEHASFEDAGGPATQHIAKVCYGFHMHRGNPAAAATVMAFAAHRAKNAPDSKHDEQTVRWCEQVGQEGRKNLYIHIYFAFSPLANTHLT